jgi:hypothetical protein
VALADQQTLNNVGAGARSESPCPFSTIVEYRGRKEGESDYAGEVDHQNG